MKWRFESAAEMDASKLHAEIMDRLNAEGAPDSDFASAEVIFSELIGNIVRYAHGGVAVEFEWKDDFPQLIVRDEQSFALPAIRLPSDPLAESGRGLYMIQALAKDFRFVDEPGGGSAVCATLPVRKRVA